MAHDDEWWARQMERRARLRQRMQEDHDQRERGMPSPVRRIHGGRLRRILIMLATVLVLFVCGELAFTLGRFSGNDINDAKRLGRATVRSCERHGPIGYGFGYWDECTAEIVWNDGRKEIVAIDKPGFFKASEIGSTVVIGDAGRYRNGRTFSRSELPARPLVDVVATVLALIAGLPLILVGVALALLLRGRRH
jgi:hypothetical protein